jgi:hypothetical protein
MRLYELTIVSVATLIAQAVAIQVECRQANIIRQNDEYFERAKKAVHPGAEDIKPVEEVSHSYIGIDPNALVEHATTLGKSRSLFARRKTFAHIYSLAFVPRNYDQEDKRSYSAQQIRLHQDISRYLTSTEAF